MIPIWIASWVCHPEYNSCKWKINCWNIENHFYTYGVLFLTMQTEAGLFNGPVHKWVSTTSIVSDRLFNTWLQMLFSITSTSAFWRTFGNRNHTFVEVTPHPVIMAFPFWTKTSAFGSFIDWTRALNFIGFESFNSAMSFVLVLLEFYMI